MVVAISRRELSVDDLEGAAARTQDAKAARRMLAIGLVLDGHSREDAAASCGMDRQTLRDWVHRYNDGGLAGLADRPRRNGSKPRLSPEQEATMTEWVEQGPELERDGVVRWRCVDLQGRIAREFRVNLHERTVGKLLRNSASAVSQCARSSRAVIPKRRRFSERICWSGNSNPTRRCSGQTG